jgi:Fe-S-cluster-containing dehydrogenase component
MSRKWNLIIDVSRCDNCRNCFLATKDEHIGNEFPGYAAAQPANRHSWVDIRRKERGCWPVIEANFMPVMCNHCDDAPCIKAAQNGAVSKRPDGIVIIDPKKSRGQKAIVDACPYGAVFWNEEEQIPQAWIFDAHLLDQGWQKIRVESVCPLDVFRSVKVEDSEMRRLQDREGLEVLQPELGTRPRVYYKNLHLMNRCFAAGTVVTHTNGIEDCVEGVEVILSLNGSEIARTHSDTFGEFKFDKLKPDSGAYELAIVSRTGKSISLDFTIKSESLYLGVLDIAAAL